MEIPEVVDEKQELKIDDQPEGEQPVDVEN